MTKVITVTRKNGDVHEVLVDKDIILPSSVFKWGRYYAVRDQNKKKNVYLHRWLMSVDSDDLVVDHKDGNPKNNSKSNLRVCTRSQNQHNKGGKGYVVDKGKEKPYRAKIAVDGKTLHLGSFRTRDEASSKYREAHVKYFGEFSPYYKEETK